MTQQSSDSILWRSLRRLLLLALSRAARKVLVGRSFTTAGGEPMHWGRPELDTVLAHLKVEAEVLRPIAERHRLPRLGSRLMVELALLTIGTYRVLCQLGLSREDAQAAVGDVAWSVYAGHLRLASLPFRLTARDPALRLRRTLGLLLRFPFSAPGAPAYAVETWSDGADTYTHFTHCPPQSFVRDLIETLGDHGELEAFSASWCEFDWPGADLIAGDGKRSHYSRTKTLSRGDEVCDMCWHGQACAGGVTTRFES